MKSLLINHALCVPDILKNLVIKKIKTKIKISNKIN